MAETLISPGVLARENDQSQITQQPVTVGAAIIGPTVKGLPNIPTIVTSYSDYQNKFGSTFESGSNVYTYFTSIAAYNYFANGGETMLVTRVVTGSFTAATTATGSGSPIIAYSASAEALVFDTITQGAIMNSTGSQDISGSLISGSANNIRWQIVNSNTSSGTFDLLVRQGNDNSNIPIVLETWTNLSMDPTAPNFVSKVIGDQIPSIKSDGSTLYVEVTGNYNNNSRYVRVKNVNLLTPNYFDNNGNPKTEFTGSIPQNGSGSFGAATGTLFVGGGAAFYSATPSVANSQGIPSSSYATASALLANQDEYRYNILLTPGLYNSLQTSPITTLISNTQNRGDAIYIVDPAPYGSTVSTVVTQAASRNSSYATMYWPWCQVLDPDTGAQVFVPASTMIGGVYAYNDQVSEPWFAPAGINRGGLGQVLRAEQKLTQTQRDTLYGGKINPLATFPGTGVVVYGQKTLQTQASALDRVNVRRLLIELKSYISQVANNLVFEQNTASTRNQFLSQVNPYLESVQQRQGLYAFKVVMDDSNNTPDVIDRNQLVGAIYIQPTRTAEFIYLDFNILPTGATFPA
jgi:phage tail sheath protein FI